jgi:hypothetical protein
MVRAGQRWCRADGAWSLSTPAQFTNYRCLAEQDRRALEGRLQWFVVDLPVNRRRLTSTTDTTAPSQWPPPWTWVDTCTCCNPQRSLVKSV